LFLLTRHHAHVGLELMTLRWRVAFSTDWASHAYRILLVLMIFTVLRTGQVCCRVSLKWDLSNYFLMINSGVMGFGEKDHEGKVPFSSYQIKDSYYQHELSLFTLTFITWSSVCQVSPLWSYFFSYLQFSYCTLWKEVTMQAHFWEVRSNVAPPWD